MTYLPKAHLFIFNYQYETDWITLSSIWDGDSLIGCIVSWDRDLIVSRAIGIAQIAGLAENLGYRLRTADRDLPASHMLIEGKQPDAWGWHSRTEKTLRGYIEDYYLSK